ncbi:hypothetical protein [Sphingomonas sp.]|uniref:hypothetical protein n=1 Tax=Sphingomonas sp. TaxID=28214 RepID=UPI001EB23FAB|nr:hypothetical protein [Sphingomonas sp.]MBX3593114.1 hypothetical protein [Sphingomonas sp.]
MAMLAVTGCARRGDIDEGGITQIRSACPRVGVPAGTGDVTLFDPPASRDASAIDVTAVITNVTSTCEDSGDMIRTSISFDVLGSRRSGAGAREVTLPYFVTVLQGGSSVVSKRVGQATLRFAPGALRAQAQGSGMTEISRAAATLPSDIRDKITEKRKAGDQTAAMDPLSRPEIRQAVLRATFEALVGFQLTDDQLKYNATR